MVTQSKYDNKTKQQWRGWVWNNIKKRLTKHAFDARVLYLAGDGNYDMDEGLKRGFKRHNMIAVDIDKKNVENARRMGCVGACCDVQMLLAYWPERFALDAVVLDYCCGMTDKVIGTLFDMFFSSAVSNNTTVIVNVQRGRDDVAFLAGNVTAVNSGAITHARDRSIYTQAVLPVVWYEARRTAYGLDTSWNELDARYAASWARLCKSRTSDETYSYRPHRVWMDSWCGRWPERVGTFERTDADTQQAAAKVRRIAAAVKAVNTRKTKRR